MCLVHLLIISFSDLIFFLLISAVYAALLTFLFALFSKCPLFAFLLPLANLLSYIGLS